MTLVHTATPRTINRDRVVSSRRPGPSGPPGTRTRYCGNGVAMSTAPHARRPVPLATTLGLALLAGIITLWLGLVADLGHALNGDSAVRTASVPDRLAVVRVLPGESLADVAHRVAPGAPVREVAERIRELNDLSTAALTAGQPLIAPVS